MKMITLPKLRDALRDQHEVRVPTEIAERARHPDRAHGRHLVTRGAAQYVIVVGGRDLDEIAFVGRCRQVC